MNNKEELNLDSKLLLPIKQNLENVINRLMYAVINNDKEAEINLKITIDKKEKEYTEPVISYQITEKIKAYKETSKGNIGHNFKIEQEDNKFIVQEINKQESLFENENPEEEEDE